MRRCSECDGTRVKKTDMYEYRCVECGHQWGSDFGGLFKDTVKDNNMLRFDKLNLELYLKSGSKLAIDEGYKQLQQAGWLPTASYHPVAKSWMWQRGDAKIHYDITHEFDWIVSIGDDVYGMDGNIASMTEDVDQMLSHKEEKEKLALDKKLVFYDALHMIGSGKWIGEQELDDNGVVR